MTKILGKLFYYIKNFVLPILFIATIYIVLMMFQRLGKEPFGSNFLEFIEVILPYFILIILLLINTFLKQDEVRNNFFYNITSFLALATIFIFCYRAIFDKNLILWHKLKYDIDFNYFTDQIAPMKTILYLLSAANIMLIVKGYLKDKQEVAEVTEVKEDNFKIEDSFEDNSTIELEESNYQEPKTQDDYKEDSDTLEITKPKEEVKINNNNQHKNKNYYYNNNNKNKKNNYYKKNNNYYKKNNNNNNNNQNKPKKTLDFYE